MGTNTAHVEMLSHFSWLRVTCFFFFLNVISSLFVGGAFQRKLSLIEQRFQGGLREAIRGRTCKKSVQCTVHLSFDSDQ